MDSALRMSAVLVLLVAVWGAAGAGLLPWTPPPSRCERIELPACQQLGYQWTVMPNLMGNRNQKEAEEAMSAYAPLLASQCSESARFFLCSAFAPLCSEEVSGAVGGCRALCDRVVAACALEVAALPPAARALLHCARFPDRADRSRLCMRPPPPNATEPTPAPHPWPFDDAEEPAPCPPGLARAAAGDCAPPPCRDAPPGDARTAAVAALALLSTAFAVLTFCADPSRFRYPERPVVFLAACHAVVALAHLAHGWITPRAGSCAAAADRDGLTSTPCATFFAVTYYFTLAADAWFVNACVAWYLTAASEWSTEALERATAYFHAAAWGWAGAWTAAALALRRGAAEEACGAGMAAAAAAALVGVPRGALLAAAAALGAGAAPGVRRVRRALDARGARRVGRLAARAAAAGALYWAAEAAGAVASVRAGAGGGEAAAALGLGAGCAAGAWAWSRKSVRVWRRALCPPRKAPPTPGGRAPQPLLAPAHLAASCKRPHVSRV